MATQLAEHREDAVKAFRGTLTTLGDQLKMALPSHVSVDKFHRTTMTALQQNPMLLNCDRRSLLSAILKAAQDGLLPDGREGALVKFRTKRDGQYIDAVQWMPMIGGVLKKVRNSGELASIDALLVHAADRFTYRPGIDEVPAHEPDWFGDRGQVIGVYAVAKLKSGASFVEIMNRQQIEQVRAVSRAKDDGPWSAWWGEMARKTVLRRLAKRLPMSTDIEAEFERDETMTADVAAAAIAAVPAPVSRLEALEAQVCGPDEDPEPIGEDQDDITPAAVEEAAGVEPEGEAGEAAASASGGLFSEPEHIALGSEIEAKLKLATSGDALAASWLTLTDDLKRLKAMDGPTYDAIVRLKNRMKAELTGGAE
jgi:recombination protein RecT